MTNELTDPRTRDGWGIDHDPRNNPAYPMRDLPGDVSPERKWVPPTPQTAKVEVLKSIEYDRRPAVFGTSAPPSGASGAIRRLAFKRSESNWWHWLLLVAADRVGMVEGIVDDLRHGIIPNIPAEMGLKSEWKHNREAFVGTIATTVAISAVAALLVATYRSRPAIPRDRLRSHRSGR